MAAPGTTGTTASMLVSSKISACHQHYVTVLTLVIFGKKSVAGVATLKPPKEDGGFFCVWFASYRNTLTQYCHTD